MFVPFKSQQQETSDQPNTSKFVVNGVSSTVDVKNELTQKIISIAKANETPVETQPTENNSAKSDEASESEPREKIQERTDANDESFIVTPDYIQQSKSLCPLCKTIMYNLQE